MSHHFKELSEVQLNELIHKERSAKAVPISSWHLLAAQLKDEGIITQPSVVAQSATPSVKADSLRQPGIFFGKARSMVRYASILAVLVVGVAIGRYTVPAPGSSLLPADEYAEADQGDSAELVFANYKSPEEALKVLHRSQVDYQQAVAYLSVKGDPSMAVEDDESLRVRLAALDILVSAARNAIQGVPEDPVLKQYYLSSNGARQATLQMLNRKMSDSKMSDGRGLVGY